MNNICTLDSNMKDIPEEDSISNWDYDEAKFKPLDEETYKALVTFATNNADGWTPHKDALLHTQCMIWGLQYKCSTAGKRDSMIFFQPLADAPLIPGIILQIFSLPRANPDGLKTQGRLLAVQ